MLGRAAAAIAVLGLVNLYVASLLPILVGWQPAVMMTGSMAPAVRPGDVLIISPAKVAALHEGQVIRFKDPAGRSVVHRVTGVNPDRTVRTRGDANPGDDAAPLALARVDGLVRLRIPLIGLPALWVAKGSPVPLLGTASIGAMILLFLLAKRRRRGRHRAAGRAFAVSRQAVALTVLSSLIASAGVVWQTSHAAFSSRTSNQLNSFVAATVSLTDDDGGNSPSTGTAMFTVSALQPSDPAASKCIKVTYGGNKAALVKLYGTSLTGTGLGTYLNLTVEVGSPGAFASCGTFSGSTLFTGTLAGFVGSYTNYGNGLSTGWTPTSNGNNTVFRFTYSMQNNPSAFGLTCGLGFIFEAQT